MYLYVLIGQNSVHYSLQLQGASLVLSIIDVKWVTSLVLARLCGTAFFSCTKDGNFILAFKNAI